MNLEMERARKVKSIEKERAKVKISPKDYESKKEDWAESAQNFNSTSPESSKQSAAVSDEDSIAAFLRENADRIEEIISGTGNGNILNFALTLR